MYYVKTEVYLMYRKTSSFSVSTFDKFAFIMY